MKIAQELATLPLVLRDFWGKIFLLFYSIIRKNLTVLLPLLREILCNMCFVIVCETGCEVIIFEIDLIFLIKLFFLYVQKTKPKI